MSAHCCSVAPAASVHARSRRVRWAALGVNVAMFVAEWGASWSAGSVALLADSIAFFGDAVNYALSVAVLGMALSTRAKAAMFKAASMGAFGLCVVGKALWNLQAGIPPEAVTMGAVGLVALAANVGVAWMLYRF